MEEGDVVRNNRDNRFGIVEKKDGTLIFVRFQHGEFPSSESKLVQSCEWIHEDALTVIR